MYAVYMHTCMCEWGHMDTYMLTFVKDRRGHWVTFYITLLFFPSCLYHIKLQAHMTMPEWLHDDGDLNSDAHVWTVSAFANWAISPALCKLFMWTSWVIFYWAESHQAQSSVLDCHNIGSITYRVRSMKQDDIWQCLSYSKHSINGRYSCINNIIIKGSQAVFSHDPFTSIK